MRECRHINQLASARCACAGVLFGGINALDLDTLASQFSNDLFQPLHQPDKSGVRVNFFIALRIKPQQNDLGRASQSGNADSGQRVVADLDRVLTRVSASRPTPKCAAGSS